MYSATRGNDGCVLHPRRTPDRSHIIQVRIEDARTGIASGPLTLVFHNRLIWRTMIADSCGALNVFVNVVRIRSDAF